MSSSNDRWKWHREEDLFTDLDSFQAAQQEERIEQFGKPLKPPEKTISWEEAWERHNTLVRSYVEAKQKQDIQHEEERLTLQRYVDEHADCQSFSVCMEKLPSPPTPCPTELPPPNQHQPYHMQYWETSVGNIKSLESFTLTDDGFSTYSSMSESDKQDQHTSSTSNSDQELRCSTPISSDLAMTGHSTVLTSGVGPEMHHQANQASARPSVSSKEVLAPNELTNTSSPSTKSDGPLVGLPTYLASLLPRSLPFMKSITSFFLYTCNANSNPVPASNQVTHGEEQHSGNKNNKGGPNAKVLGHHAELPHDPSRIPVPPGAPVTAVPDQTTIKQVLCTSLKTTYTTTS